MKGNVKYDRELRDLARRRGATLFTIDVDGPLIKGRITGQGTLSRREARQLTRMVARLSVPRCRKCGCTEQDCRRCVGKTGEPCAWVREHPPHPEGPICSACVSTDQPTPETRP